MLCAPAFLRPRCGRHLRAPAAFPWALALAVWLALAGPCAAADIPSAAADRVEALQASGRARPEQAASELAALLKTLPADDLQHVRALELLGWLRAAMNDAEGSERIARQLESGTERPAPVRRRAEAAASMVRAKALYHDGPMARAERLAGEALSRLPEDTPPLQRLPYLLLAGDIQERSGHLDEAARLQLQALAIADASAPPWRRSEVRSTLAYTLNEAGQKERARALNREAIELARAAGDDMALSSAMTIESILLTGTHDEAAELAALQGAIDHARRAGAARDETLGLANIADFYLKRGEYATALQMSERALLLARELRMRSSESLALENKGLALIGLRRIAEGLKAVHEGLAIDARMGATTSMAGVYEELGEALEKTGALKDALEAYREHRRLADEVFRQEQQKAVLELQENYDNERRRRELELLGRQNRLKEEQLLQRELQQRLWGLGAVCGLLLLGVIALLVQRARRANRLLASANEVLKAQSERDPLTGLANRRHFQQALRRPGRETPPEGTVFLLDVDHFKQINDRHGHAAGDAVLVETARRLRAALREQDLLVRWGGEEFLAVVRALSPEQVEALALRLLAAVASTPVPVDGKAVPVTASIGFATFPLEPAGVVVSWERAIELVDTTMYLAKAHGRNRAYGVRLLRAADADAVDQVTRTLEQSWREGRVALALLQGPAPAPGGAR